MAVRPEVVALLTDFDVEHTSSGQRFVHRDGRPFTAEETDLVVSATGEDMRAAAANWLARLSVLRNCSCLTSALSPRK
jgi:hypothetical protein